MSAAAAGAEGRLPVVAGVRGGYRFALQMARNAEEAGADAILVFPPPGGPQTLEGQRRYFTEIARSVGIGVLIYPRTQRDDWSRLLEELADLPNVLGFKDGSGGIALGQSLGPQARDRLVWTARGEEHALRALPAGATAYATSFASLAPKACHEFWRRGTRGDANGMETLFRERIGPLAGIRHQLPLPDRSPGFGVAAIKAALQALGRAGGSVRPPKLQVGETAGIAEIAAQLLGVDPSMMESKRRQFLRTVGLLAGGTLAASAGCSPTPGPRRSMEELTRACRGVHNFLTTPFLADGALDTQGLRNNVAYHADRHPRDMTMVVTCNLGELFSLDLEEHQAAGRAAVKGAQGKMPVIQGVAGGYQLTLEMARNAEKAGVDALMLFAPPYGSSTAQGVYQYMHRVATAVRMGVFVNMWHGYALAVEDYWAQVIRELAELPNVIGFQDSSGGLQVGHSLGALIPDRFLWIARGEGHAVKALPAGARPTRPRSPAWRPAPVESSGKMARPGTWSR